MKYTILFTFSFLLLFSSCITIQTSSQGFVDEIYFSESDYQIEEEVVDAQEQQAVEEEVIVEEEEVVYDDSYRSDDYYDYGYSSRIRRFYGPQIGFGYYHNYYTNSFWYDSNPNNYGVSIYYGYNFWNPYQYSHYNYYNPWYSGYQYGYGYSHHYYGPPQNHYWHGYNGGLYASNSYPTYFNSFDNNSVYHGHRVNNKARTPQRFATMYQQQTPAQIQNSLNQSQSVRQPSSVVRRPASNQNQNQNSSYKNPVRGNTSSTRPASTNVKTNIKKPISNVSRPVSTPKPVKINSNTNYKKPSSTYKKPSRSNSSVKSSSPSRSSSQSRSPSRSSSPSRSNSSKKPRN
jgi:hypothetical protein